MRNYVLKVLAKTVGKFRLNCAETIYLYTCEVFLPRLVYKTSSLCTACPVFVPRLSTNKKRDFYPVNVALLPTIHTTNKDNQKLINLFSY